MASTWTAYNELAWTEDVFADPAECEREVMVYIDLIERTAPKPPRTLLHLGCGAGFFDATFKRYFEVTGVDLSRGMLERARAAHPDIGYLEGDMRTLRLGRTFDAVAIPDSIDYMSTKDDLRKIIHTSSEHLKPGGVLLIVAKPEETFQDNNFVYTGTSKDGTHVTLFENNYINPNRPNTYECTLIYLIRHKGKLTIHTENHVLGLFPRSVWEEIFREEGFTMQTQVLEGVYDKNLLGEGEYPMTIFVGKKAR